MTRLAVLLAGLLCASSALAADAPAAVQPVIAVQPGLPPAPPPPQPPRSMPVPGTRNCAKFYPADSLHLKEQGDVRLAYDVDADGVISHVTVTTSSGFDRLDHAAVACAATQWRDTPAMVDGKPVPSPGHAAIISFSTPPQTPDEFIARGRRRLALGWYGGAIDDFDGAIALDPKSADAYRARADAYDASGKPDLAKADRATARHL